MSDVSNIQIGSTLGKFCMGIGENTEHIYDFL